MNSSSTIRKYLAVYGAIMAGLVLSTALLAQDTTTSSAHTGQATVNTEVKSGEVVYVSGNDLVVKLEDGEVRHFNVPDDFKFNVDGKDISVHELKPGMRLTRTITTTTTPKTVKTVRTINGRVWSVNAPSSVILTLPDHTNKKYKVPEGQKFQVNGQDKTVFDLKKGMQISATVISEEPLTEQSSTRTVSGQAPPTPETPPAVGVLLIEESPAETASSAPPTQEVAQAQMPQTATNMPLLGLLGLLFIAASLVLRESRATN